MRWPRARPQRKRPLRAGGSAGLPAFLPLPWPGSITVNVAYCSTCPVFCFVEARLEYCQGKEKSPGGNPTRDSRFFPTLIFEAACCLYGLWELWPGPLARPLFISGNGVPTEQVRRKSRTPLDPQPQPERLGFQALAPVPSSAFYSHTPWGHGEWPKYLGTWHPCWRPGLSSRLLASAWPSSSCCGHLGSESAEPLSAF